jgi:hypothetical protein
VSSFGPDVAAADFARAGVKSGITDFGAKGWASSFLVVISLSHLLS